MMNPLTTSATQMIRMDHAKVMAQFHKLGPQSSPRVCDATVRTICTALEIHAQIEEELFYPALREAGAGELIANSASEHAEMKRGIERLRGLRGQPQAQMDALCTLMNGVMHHVADEETQVLPLAEQKLGAQQLAELGRRMTQRRLALARPHAGELVADMARAAPGKTSVLATGVVLATTMLVLRMLRHRRMA